MAEVAGLLLLAVQVLDVGVSLPVLPRPLPQLRQVRAAGAVQQRRLRPGDLGLRPDDLPSLGCCTLNSPV